MAFDLASYIDHTLLKQAAHIADIDRVCLEASHEHFAAVCIPPKYVAEARKTLDGSKVKVATVIAFPMGFGTKESKAEEIRAALAMGADEVDMVIDLCALKSGHWLQLEEEIKACLEPVREQGKVIKVIVESGMLTEGELIACCELYGRYPVDYIKTSTGFAEQGASVAAVQLIKQHVPAGMGIKASGGIKSYKFAKELIDAGATRIGCSGSMEIMKEFKAGS